MSTGQNIYEIELSRHECAKNFHKLYFYMFFEVRTLAAVLTDFTCIGLILIVAQNFTCQTTPKPNWQHSYVAKLPKMSFKQTYGIEIALHRN